MKGELNNHHTELEALGNHRAEKKGDEMGRGRRKSRDASPHIEQKTPERREETPFSGGGGVTAAAEGGGKKEEVSCCL